MPATEQMPQTIEALVVVDTVGTILHWDSGAEQLYGWTAHDALGKRFRDLIVPDRLKTKSAEIFARAAAGYAWAGQFQFRHADGGEVLVDLVRTPITEPGGRVVAVAGSHRPARIPDLAWDETSLSADTLTDSERNVVALVANGLTDEEIATALGVPTGSIAALVDSILAVLNVTRRVQIATWAAQHGLWRPRENESV